MDHTTSVRSELASVIVPCWNQLEFTRQCIAALMRLHSLPLGADRRQQRLDRWYQRLPGGRARCVGGAGDSHCEFDQPGVPSGRQPGAEVCTGGISRAAQQ